MTARPALLSALSALLLLALVALPGAARAATCQASVTDIDFGSVSVRAGAVNQTSGHVRIDCSALVSVVGVCVRFGPGSGGAGGNNAPRYMRNAAGDALAYQLRPLGNGAVFGTLNTVFVNVPVVLGSGHAEVPIFADLISDNVSVDSGPYSSSFSGASNIELTYGVLSCDLLGTNAPVPGFTVAADVVPSCELDVSSLDFGAISSTVSSPADAQASVNVRCTSNTSYSVTLDNGTGPGATGPADRVMRNGPYSLRYGLFRDPGRSLAWGDQPGNSVSAIGQGSNQAFPIYGRIFAGQTARIGVYSDSVVVTVNY